MGTLPTLTTARLVLRPFSPGDAPSVRELAGAYEVAAYTLSMPHPYPEGAAEAWIAGHDAAWEEGREGTWAITCRPEGNLMGAISLRQNAQHRHAEIGYWITVPQWNKGFMTEAAQAVVDFGFAEMGLMRIYATHCARNPASGRVMQKIGMSREGVLRQHVLRWGVPQDLVYYGILREEWQRARETR
ncbi:MAG: GNAT family N-acetyltransferase [Chloroflexi bacterium]|nr:GNAT family N-acetyltransferase [Chloroflexota bacterium]